MARKNRGHRPPPQSRAIPPGQVPVIDPNRQQTAQAQAEAQIRARVEGVAAQIFTDAAGRVVDSDLDDAEFDERVARIAERSIDSALILGKELWGIQATRSKPQAPPKRRPRVITEDDDDGGEEQEE